MANVSYCRFQNTLNDLRDCHNALDGRKEQLSSEEARARQELIRLCKVIAEDYGHEAP